MYHVKNYSNPIKRSVVTEGATVGFNLKREASIIVEKIYDNDEYVVAEEDEP